MIDTVSPSRGEHTKKKQAGERTGDDVAPDLGTLSIDDSGVIELLSDDEPEESIELSSDDEPEESKKEGRVKPVQKVPSKFQPMNKEQQASDKAAGFITGYFKLSKGRPPKQEDSRPERKPLYKNLKSTPSSKSKKGKKRNAKGSNEKKNKRLRDVALTLTGHYLRIGMLWMQLFWQK